MEIASLLVMNANMFLIPSTVRGGRGLPCEATLNIKENQWKLNQDTWLKKFLLARHLRHQFKAQKWLIYALLNSYTISHILKFKTLKRVSMENNSQLKLFSLHLSQYFLRSCQIGKLENKSKCYFNNYIVIALYSVTE